MSAPLRAVYTYEMQTLRSLSRNFELISVGMISVQVRVDILCVSFCVALEASLPVAQMAPGSDSKLNWQLASWHILGVIIWQNGK